jgi:hypothetical protein
MNSMRKERNSSIVVNDVRVASPRASVVAGKGSRGGCTSDKHLGCALPRSSHRLDLRSTFKAQPMLNSPHGLCGRPLVTKEL